MIDKTIPTFNDAGDTKILFDASEGLNKVAHFNTHIPDKLAHIIKDIESNADPSKTYLYDRALGAGEVYGPNNNGDWFGKEALLKHHHTFEKHAYLFRHHQNKDPKNKIGDVVASAYNHPLDTVDLILEAPTKNIQKDLDKFEQGRLIQTSMGAGVKYDVCSYCGNKASTRMQYCTHLRHRMLNVMPDGRQVYAKNPKPRFKDISIVVIHAAPESAVLKKIASLKLGGMKKEDVGSNVEDRGGLHPAAIEATNHLDRASAVRTLHDAVDGPLRPDEFSAILHKDASLIRHDMIPSVAFRRVEEVEIPGRSIQKIAHVLSQLPMEKTASIKKGGFDMPDDELYEYMQYRISLGPFDRRYFK